MKRFVSIFLLCVILPFMFLCPLSSNALNIQGTEYPTPSFLPIDVDFSQYDYYFVTVSGNPDSPSYRIYLFKDNNKSGRLYVSATLSASSTRFYNETHTAFDVTTDYEISFSSYTLTSGTWGTPKVTTSSSTIVNFSFDGYSDYTSSSKYIIGCNADIYDYSGNLVRKGDYDNLVSYFKGGLNGGEDKSDSGSSSGGGSSVNLDFLPNKLDTIISKLDEIKNAISSISSGDGSSANIDFLPDKLDSIGSSLEALATAIETMTIAASTKVIEETLSEIKTGVNNVSSTVAENFDEFTNTFTQKIQLIRDDISTFEAHLVDFKSSFLEFASVSGEIKNLAGLFSEVHVSISNLRKGLEDAIETITTSFNDFADDVKANVSSIRMIVNDFTGKFDTIISKLGLLLDSLNDISGKISDCYSDLNNISYYTNWINTNIRDYLSKIFDTVDSIDAILNGYCVSMSKNLIDFSSSVSSLLRELINAVNGLPDKFGELLKDLFIPQEDHFTELIDEINSHFGFVHQIIKLGDVLVNESDFDDVQPSYSISFDSDTYGHFKTDIIDFSVVAPYVDIIKGINTGIILYFFIRRTRRKLPDIINGTGGD